jgi:hypothetical protein
LRDRAGREVIGRVVLRLQVAAPAVGLVEERFHGLPQGQRGMTISGISGNSAA